MDELKTGNITSARTCRGWRIKMNGQDLRLLPWHGKDHSPENMTVMRRLALNILRQAEKPENKKQDSLSKRMIWFRENRQFRQTVLRLL